jgi:hypothetical protein
MNGKRNSLIGTIAVLLLAVSVWGLTGCSDIASVAPDSAELQSSETNAPTTRTPADPNVEPMQDSDAPELPVIADKAGRVLTMYAGSCWRVLAQWQNVNGALGAPGPNDNQNQNAFAYNDVMNSTDQLWARAFNPPAFLPGERITGVYVDVNARYDAGTSADTIRLFVDYPVNGSYNTVARDMTWSQGSLDDVFRWRMGGSYGWNITGLRTSWTRADVAQIWLGARRFANIDPVGTSRARLNAYRIVITTVY